MTQLLAQWRFNRASALPEDVVVNTWSFIDPSDAAIDLAAESIAEGLTAFYDGLESWMPNFLSSGELRVYDHADPLPREPVIIDLPGAAGTASTGYPEEVSLALSFYKDRSLPSQRGRVFLGPFASNAGAVAAGYVRPQSALLTAIQTAVGDMQSALAAPVGSGPAGIQHAVYSRKNNLFHAVTNYWIDNSFDTIRSRGGAPSTRTEFT